MVSLKGSQTEKNLLIAFAGESQARNRYTFFASQAKKMDMKQSQKFSKKPQTKKKNTQNVFLNILKVATLKSQRISQLVK